MTKENIRVRMIDTRRIEKRKINIVRNKSRTNS
jgi:hypothetical protein